MKTINIFFRFALLSLTGLLLFSCTQDKMDNVNDNPNDPKDVPANNIFLELATSTATNVLGADLAHYASVYMELQTGVHNQFWNAEARTGEPITSTTYNNSWRSIYVNIRNAKTIMEKCSAGGLEEGYNSLLGMTKIMLAINVAVLTDLFGDAPFSQTAIFDEKGMPVYPQPEIESQEFLYSEVFRLLDEGIVHLGEASNAEPRGYDLVYNGDKDKWIKAANGLKAKYTMQLLYRSSHRNADLEKILAYIDNSYSDVSDQMIFDQYYGDNWNPLGAFTWARMALGASESYINKMRATGDHRWLAFLGEYYDDTVGEYLPCQALDIEDIYAAPQENPENAQGYYDELLANYCFSSPVYYLSYKEILFLKAEALVRLNRDLPEAKECIRQALILDYEKLNESITDNALVIWYGYPIHTAIDEDLAMDYFNSYVSDAFDTDPLRTVIYEKYMACLGANGEPLIAYNDYRRLMALGESDYIVRENSLQFPLRYPYGNDDVLNHAAIREAYGNGQYVWSSNVWWAGGTN